MTARHALLVFVALHALLGCAKHREPASIPPDLVGGYVLETTLPGAELLLLPDGRAHLLSMPGHHRVGGWSLSWENREDALYLGGDLPELLFPRLYIFLHCDGAIFMMAPEDDGDPNCDALRTREDLARWRKVTR